MKLLSLTFLSLLISFLSCSKPTDNTQTPEDTTTAVTSPFEGCWMKVNVRHLYYKDDSPRLDSNGKEFPNLTDYGRGWQDTTQYKGKDWLRQVTEYDTNGVMINFSEYDGTIEWTKDSLFTDDYRVSFQAYKIRKDSLMLFSSFNKDVYVAIYYLKTECDLKKAYP